MQEHPEDHEKLEKLKDLIAWQVRLKLSETLSVVFFILFASVFALGCCSSRKTAVIALSQVVYFEKMIHSVFIITVSPVLSRGLPGLQAAKRR